MTNSTAPFHIQKANGSLEPYQKDKILIAVRKAALHTDKPLTDEEEKVFTRQLGKYLNDHVPRPDVVLDVEDVHQLVLRTLRYVRPDISSKYNEYKNHKVKQAEQANQLIQQLATKKSFIDADLDEREIEERIRERIKTIIHKLKTKHHIDHPAAFVVLNILFEDIHYQKQDDVDALLSVLKADVGLQTLINWIIIEIKKAEQ